MSTGIDNELNWQYLGALLAQNGTTEQVEFFKAFAKECSFHNTQLHVDCHIAGVNNRLTQAERRTLRMLGYEED